MKRFRFFTLILIAAVVLNLTACGKFQSRINAKKGTELYKARKYEEAIEKYKVALKQDPSLIQMNLFIGLAYMAMYQPGSAHEKDVEYSNQAVNYFKEYLKNVSDPAEKDKVNEYLVTIYLNANRTDDAIAFFEQRLKDVPSDTETMQKLAYLYAQKGEFENALKWYKTRAAVDPNNEEAYYTIGVICWERSYKFPVSMEEREKLVSTGMEALDKAIKLNAEYSEAYLYMNLLYREKAKLIAPDAASVPQERIDEYNGLLEKAKEYQDKAVELRKKMGAAQ